MIRGLREATDVPISIDTTKAVVAEAAIAAGASFVNDVSAMRVDPRMAEVVAGAGVPVCLMHMLGDPKTMQDDPRYDDVVEEVASFLAERVRAAQVTRASRTTRSASTPASGSGRPASTTSRSCGTSMRSPRSAHRW